MQGYHISQSNGYTIRTQVTGSSEFTMSLEDMTTQYKFTASLSDVSYSAYESILAFTASISGAVVASEYRATLFNSGAEGPIWYGSFQAFASTSVSIPKSDYENQNKQYISNQSDTRYVIMD